MKRIGLISDTHSWWDERYSTHFSNCDEIWHAGDIGNCDVAERLAAIAPLRAVHGNIDGQTLRMRYPKHLRFTLEGVDVWITHIGGYPGRYAPEVMPDIRQNPPQLFVCGHSHILKVINDKQLHLLHINPGAAGKYGFHTVRTLVRFTLDRGVINDLEVIELG